MKTTSSAYNLPLLRWREFQFTTHNPGNVATQLTNSAAVTMVTAGKGNNPVFTWNNHRLQTGDFVNMVDTDLGFYNGLRLPVTVLTANTFSVFFSGAETEGNSIGVTATIVSMAQEAHLIADSGNAAAVSFGADPLADFYPIPAGAEYTLRAPHGAKFDIADLWVKSASASQTLRVLFI